MSVFVASDPLKMRVSCSILAWATTAATGELSEIAVAIEIVVRTRCLGCVFRARGRIGPSGPPPVHPCAALFSALQHRRRKCSSLLGVGAIF